MTKKLHLLLALGMFILGARSATAQINYTQSFDDENHGWTLLEFDETTTLPCDGAGSLSVNLYIDWDWFGGVYEAEIRSSSLGTSNGGELTVSFDYKVLDYPLSSAEPTTSDDWGAISVYYAYSATGPWTLLETLNPEDHVPSPDCTTFSTSFFPGTGQEVFIGIYAEHNFGFDDFYVFLDNFSATQAMPIECSAAPAASTVTAGKTSMCNNETTTVTINTVYTDGGITYKWQSSPDNVTYTDIAGQTGTSYQVSQTASTWYRAVVICSNGNLSTPTSAVQIVSTGDICYCPVAFASGREPITLVDFAGINNVTPAATAGAPAYEDFTTSIPAPTLVIGQSYPIALEGNTASTGTSQFINHFNVFIDWNQNGTLDDAGEMFYIGQIQGSNGEDGMQATGSITVPPDALTGATRMRVVKRYSTQGTACNTTGYGQAEDYTVNVQATGSAGEFNISALQYYPSPVTSVLNLSYDSTITNVEVYNLVGQVVLAKKVDSRDAVIDMSSMAAGTYLVKVASENGSKAIKVVKQ